MSDFAAWSSITLLVLVIAQGIVIVAILRHLGVLYERMGPAGALMTASPLTVGARAPEFEIEDLAGRIVRIGHTAPVGNTGQLLLFMAPACPLCGQLISCVRSFARAERSVRLVLASDGPREEHVAYIARHKLDGLPYVVSPTLGLTYGVSKLPYAVAIDRDGVVRAKGIVNSREHLESLVNALESGSASLQEWLTRQQLSPPGPDGARA